MILRVSASILFLVLLPAGAQTPVVDARLPATSDARLRSILTGMAFDFTEDSTGDSTAFAIPFDGHVVMVLNKIKGLSLSACFDGGFEPMKANQWNREHFSTRAYLGETGCGSLGSDVSFGGGSTNQMIEDFVRQFCTDLVVFARFLANSPAGPHKPSASPAAGIQSLDRPASPIATMAWSQSGLPTKPVPPRPEPTRSVPGLLQIASKVSLKYDPEQWTPAADQVDGQFAFSHASGGGRALVLSERTTVPLGSVEDVVLANAQAVDPHARVVFRNRSWAKGVTFSFLKIEATVGTTPMAYWGYFYVGIGCTVQVIAYTEKSNLPEYEHAFTDFLNGLTISR